MWNSKEGNINLGLLLDFMAVNNEPLGTNCVEMCMRIRALIIKIGLLKTNFVKYCS
jgi:hypothetical protein